MKITTGHIIIGIWPLGWFGLRPELSQATGMLHPGQFLKGSLPLLSPMYTTQNKRA